MKRISIFLLLCLCLTAARADSGTWHIYAAYHDAQRTQMIHGLVYVLSDGNLYSYDPEDTSVETYDKSNVLSDNDIFTIVTCEATGELAIIYTNGNIDLLSSGGSVYNMADLKLKNLNDKTLNDVLVDGSTLYISTNSGIVCVDLEGRNFANFYSFGQAVRSVALLDGTIYAATANGIYAGQPSDNLLDPGNWSQISASSLLQLLTCDNVLYARTTSAVFRVNSPATFDLSSVLAATTTGWTAGGSTLYVFTSAATYRVSGTTATRLDNSAGIAFLTTGSDNTCWAACGSDGLKGYALSGDELTERVSSVIPDSPIRNYSYHLSMEAGNRLLVTGGVFNYPEDNRAGTLMQYENNTWTAFDEEGPIAASGTTYDYRKVTDVVQDPADDTHHFASSAGNGLYEFRDYQFAAHYTYDNSPLTSILPDDRYPGRYVRITGLAYDSGRNLWMLNNQCDTIVRILKNDGTWTSLYYDEIAGFPTFDRIVFDQRGWAWLNSRRSTSSGHLAGFLVVDTNGTLDTQGDDSHRFISTFYNQDGISYTPTLFNCIREDLDGAVWFGTDRGIFMTYSPSQVFNSDFTLTQVKVPRNDGTNLADYLLSDVPVKCITIDGGNRKWIGTSGSGVWLVSADGITTVEHFTTDNSPLVSDDIYDIAINGNTGEVFFATDGGLVSFLGDATDPAAEFDKDLVKVYPNPVRPDYNGKIRITGLAYNCNVKITNASGRLVNEGTSVGGEYTWDGCLASGKHCASGIYYVLAADADGKKGVAAKFLMVKE